MNILIMICLVVALTGLSAAALAAPRWEIDPSQLPPGLTKEKAVAMLEEIDRKTAKEVADEEAAQRRKAERVQRAAKKYEERLARAVEKDPELKALKEKLEAGMKALENPKLSEKERTARLERMAPDMKTLRSKGLAKAGIDKRAMNNDIHQALSNGVKPRGDAVDAGEVLQEKDGAFYYASPDNDELPPASEVTTRGTTTKTLSEPWPYIEEDIKVGNYAGSADKDKGTYKTVGRVMWAGGGTNRMGLAHYLTVPAGTTTIRVTAQLPETHYYNKAGSYIWGAGAQSRTYSRIEVWDGDSRRICQRSRLHADVWAVFLAFFTQQGRHNIVLECEFDAPPAGHDIVILHVSDVFVQAWGFADGIGVVEAQPANVKIDLISPTTIKKLYYR
jgi:hypothetical protein